MIELELPEADKYSIISRYRYYTVFTEQKIPVWTPLVRLGIAHYQKSPVTHTHSLFVVQDMLTETMYLYEISVWDGMNVYTIDYTKVHYDTSSFELTITQENHYGLEADVTWTAVDVTTRINHDVEGLWYQCLTDERLTPFTLLRHITGQTPVTWTCSGLTMALLGMPRDVAYLQPLSPDQLYEYLTQSN